MPIPTWCWPEPFPPPANSLYMLVKEYKDFTSNTFKHVKKKPFVDGTMPMPTWR